MPRLAPAVAALGALALSLYDFAWAVYVATLGSVDLSRGELIVELWLAVIAVTVGIAATASATRGPVPHRSIVVTLFALLLDGTRYVFVFMLAAR